MEDDASVNERARGRGRPRENLTEARMTTRPPSRVSIPVEHDEREVDGHADETVPDGKTTTNMAYHTIPHHTNHPY
jgi:hypothetical protein